MRIQKINQLLLVLLPYKIHQNQKPRGPLKKCKIAGISVVMITGDIKETTQSIAIQIGILQNQSQQQTHSFTGLEFHQWEKRQQKTKWISLLNNLSFAQQRICQNINQVIESNYCNDLSQGRKKIQ
ncbi:unnamed protein product (macronuclear) [Paramecium tetraurelia]|uniref:Uncharacterized protein n=1 Tax=Paramecium tetraurelia TaxID=5888 RepID=A0DWU9_PARTE|nr:uncharacterized protein GSPATT00021159001 [Paramecium tetraurelia]CAK87516.1 unnamed protein product [Paramecium tetraurelia]|eukprot:XP_001454913.1 hypothetical protein (macronuclear) [Paramecium tetraurelia strain d4-2]